jgi:O-acetyl-ADP-ribose deacetylase (regulator of RNase III)
MGLNANISRARIGQTVVELIQGDLTKQDTDAIVNAANSSLLGGGGVDGAIHRAAGPDLLAETRTLNGCQTGDAKITRGYKLKARHVIHAVGPIYRAGDPSVPRLLESAYRRSLEVAVENDLRTIAFPSISTGTYGYPIEEAAPISLRTVYEFARESTQLELVRFVLYNEPILKAYQVALDHLIRHSDGWANT